MREDIIFAGFGGQGIMLMGKAISYAAMSSGKFVTWMPSYGAEVRGGTAHSMVIISDSYIGSPIVRDPSIGVVMNKPSLTKFESKVRKGGLLVINKSITGTGSTRDDIDILEIPATEMASGLGNLRAANMIALGAILARREILPVQALMDSLEFVIPESRHPMIPLNREAIKKGYEYDPC
ncbi:MAG: 2-oxoacid:acceptor oxidoreductase family protein [Candidatus Omnitrophica bacterium]|nr:2-oxoacid:acceptor oxidoreductase family protein [Candidatus Omnitrophota bacterium]